MKTHVRTEGKTQVDSGVWRGRTEERRKNKDRKIEGKMREGSVDSGGATGWRRCARALVPPHSRGGEMLELGAKHRTESLSNHSTLST